MPTREERGAALVIALWVMTILYLLGIVFLSLSATESSIASNEAKVARAFNIAEAGLERAKGTLLGVDLNGVLANGGTLSFGSSVPFAGGTYQVVLSNNCSPLGSYPADTTGCPPPSTADGDNLVVVTSTGTYQNAQRVLKLLLEVPAVTKPPSPVFMLPGFDSDPTHDNVNFTIQDKPFTITGIDTNLNGTPGTGPPLIGAAVPSEARSDLVAEAAPHPTQITGASGSPSVSTTASSTITQSSLCAARSELIPQATQTFTTGTTLNAGEQIGTVASPQITYAQDQLTLAGAGPNAVIGVGILIVDRKLRMEGNSQFTGIIILCGQGEVEIQGQAKVYGAILAVNTGAFSGNSGETRFLIRGTAEIYFSREALTLASGTLPSKTRAWWEARE